MQRANQTYSAMLQMTGSYASTYGTLAQSWPSDGQYLNDDKLLASAFMLLATGDSAYRCAFHLFLSILPLRVILWTCTGRVLLTARTVGLHAMHTMPDQ